MISPKARKLLVKLLEGTEKGKLQWSRTAIEGVYELSFPDHTIQVEEVSGKLEDTRDIQLRIYNTSSDLIEEFRDTEFGDRPDDPNSAWNTMSSLYRMARGYALGVEQAYDTLLAQLTDN